MDLCETSQLSDADELSHWWLKTRLFYLKRAFRKAFDDRDTTQPLRVLEMGCGTGQNIRFLRTDPQLSTQVACVVGVDPALSDAKCQASWLVPERGDRLLRSLSGLAPDERFDLIIAMDVLEHLDDDRGQLKDWTRYLRPGGHVFVTVPAFSFLWSYHDEILGHRRRYDSKSLRSLLTGSGLRIQQLRYAFAHIFLPMFVLRVLFARNGDQRDTTDLKPTWRPLNTLLAWFGRMEAKLGGSPWFGTSVMSLCKMPR